MPDKPNRPCNKPGCGILTTNRFCVEHERQDTKRYEQQRGTASSRGYNTRWRELRKQILNEEPLCRRCASDGLIVPANLIHHIDRDPTNNDRTNLEPMCAAHHRQEHKEERYRAGG